MTLTEFLLARIDDDERIANSASGILTGPAQLGHDLWNFGDQRLEVTKRRVLAECEAKRRIVAALGPLLNPFSSAADVACTAEVERAGDVLEMLALPYADHPDYRAEWAL